MPFPRRTHLQVQSIIKERSTPHPDGCWLWNGPCTPYGKFMWLGDQGAHRASLRAFHLNGATIPAGQVVRHSCDNPACVNPDHLSLGSYTDNVHDMVSRGRMNPAIGRALPHTKLDDDRVRAIRDAAASGIRYIEIASLHGVHQSTISRIVSGARRHHVV